MYGHPANPAPPPHLLPALLSPFRFPATSALLESYICTSIYYTYSLFSKGTGYIPETGQMCVGSRWKIPCSNACLKCMGPEKKEFPQKKKKKKKKKKFFVEAFVLCRE